MNRAAVAAFSLAFVMLFTSAAAGLEADDLVRMAKAGVGDEVILAQMRAARARFALTADEIVRLKKEGVSDAVLKAMIESAQAAPAAPDGTGDGAKSPGRPVGVPAADVGTLILENLDSRDYSVQVDPEHGNIFYYGASSAEGREPLPARSSQVYRLAPGAYRLTWVAGADSHVVKVVAGRESRATLTRTSADGSEAVYLSLFEDGERRGGGRLKVLAQAAAPVTAASAEPGAVASGAVIERHYYAVPARYECYRPVQLERHHRSDCYSSRYRWLFPAFSYGWSRGRDRYAIGWGPYGDLGFSWHRQLGRSGYTIGFGW